MPAQSRTRFSLLFALVKCLWWPFISVAPSRLVVVFFTYSQPVLINRIIKFMSDDDTAAEDTAYGHQLMIAAAIVYIGIAVG